jgi:hypothetical protein
VLGFAKRLATLCLQLLHNGAIAGLALLRQLLVTHTAAEQLLDSEHEVRCSCLTLSLFPHISYRKVDVNGCCTSNTKLGRSFFYCRLQIAEKLLITQVTTAKRWVDIVVLTSYHVKRLKITGRPALAIID